MENLEETGNFYANVKIISLCAYGHIYMQQMYIKSGWLRSTPALWLWLFAGGIESNVHTDFNEWICKFNVDFYKWMKKNTFLH